MAEIDALLSSTLKRVAEPGDPTGVADAIRSRVVAGDTGTPSDGSTFDVGSGWTWLPWIGGGIVVAIVGAVVGVSGVFGSLQTADSASAPAFGVSQVAAGLDCPAGSPVVVFQPGDRVLAVARSADSAYLGVRSPADRSDTVWIALGELELDPGQASVSELEVGGCPVPQVSVTPTAEPEVTPAPDAPVPPQPPAPNPPDPPNLPQPPAPDTTSPTLGAPSGVTPIGCSPPGVTTSAISITATDNKAVTGVAISWSAQFGLDSGAGQMTKSGSTWTFTYDPPDQFGSGGDVTFTMVARDAAGNHSAPKSYIVHVNCLI